MSERLDEEPSKAQIVLGSAAAAVTVVVFVALAVPVLLLSFIFEDRGP